MPAWTLWLMLAAILVLPVLLRFAEDRPPRNEITHEQGDDKEDGRGRRDDDPDGLSAAALGPPGANPNEFERGRRYPGITVGR